MIEAALKITAIPCMLTVIITCGTIIGFIPGQRIFDFLRNHDKIQIAFVLMLGIGLIASFIVTL